VPIPFFGPAQTDAFLPAFAWFLVATVLATAPVVLAPLLRRRRSGRLLTVGAVVLAALAVVPGLLQTAQGFRTLADQHASVQRTLARQYGLDLPAEDVSSLLEGGKVGGAVVESATGSPGTVQLREVSPGRYAPVQAGVGQLPAR
jgi:hypothetical protein